MIQSAWLSSIGRKDTEPSPPVFARTATCGNTSVIKRNITGRSVTSKSTNNSWTKRELNGIQTIWSRGCLRGLLTIGEQVVSRAPPGTRRKKVSLVPRAPSSRLRGTRSPGATAATALRAAVSTRMSRGAAALAASILRVCPEGRGACSWYSESMSGGPQRVWLEIKGMARRAVAAVAPGDHAKLRACGA